MPKKATGLKALTNSSRKKASISAQAISGECKRLLGTSTRMTPTSFFRMCVSNYSQIDSIKKLSISTKDCVTCSIGYANSHGAEVLPENLQILTMSDFSQISKIVTPPNKIRTEKLSLAEIEALDLDPVEVEIKPKLSKDTSDSVLFADDPDLPETPELLDHESLELELDSSESL